MDKTTKANERSHTLTLQLMLTFLRNCRTACTVDRTRTAAERSERTSLFHLRTSSDAATILIIVHWKWSPHHSVDSPQFFALVDWLASEECLHTYLMLWCIFLPLLPPFDSIQCQQSMLRESWQWVHISVALFEPSFHHHRPLTIPTCNFIIIGQVSVCPLALVSSLSFRLIHNLVTDADVDTTFR